MPYIVQELIDDNPPLVTARLDDKVHGVLEKMFEHEFSQLPVVDDHGKPVGLVTSASILRALSNFEVDLSRLLVEHAQVGAEVFREDADLFDLLDRLTSKYAVLIVDGENTLIGIVTNYDTANFFRRRAEDMMLLEDIESMLKDYIQAAYIDEAGDIDEERLSKAVERQTNTVQKDRNTFTRALSHYLSMELENSVKPQKSTLEEVLEKHYKQAGTTKAFEDLSLYDYIELLLAKETWAKYEGAFKLDRSAVHALMDKVRLTRNALAHFRGDITSGQRESLHFCTDWLKRCQDTISTQFAAALPAGLPAQGQPSPSMLREEAAGYQVDEEGETEIVPLEADAAPNESRYAPLAVWLQNQPAHSNTVDLSFNNIEDIIDGELPASASYHRGWWANDSVGHVQSQQWLEVGWAVMSVNMSAKTVRFTRIKDRSRAYIDFYSTLLNELTKMPGFDDITIAPLGLNWNSVRRLVVADSHIGMIGFAFGRRKTFRIELYIDTGDGDLNDQIFHSLEEQQETIESSLGQELLWQPLQNRRASRIALVYSPYTITDSEEQLADLRRLAVSAMERFTEVLTPRIETAAARILEHHD